MIPMIRPTIAMLLVCAALAGCSSVKLDSDVPVESRTATPVEAGAGAGTGAKAGTTAQSQVTPVDLTGSADAAARNGRVVYFDFDSYVIKDEYQPIIEAFARSLNADRKKHVVVEGHTDERGGTEYNLALGQRRAESVTKALGLLGVPANQAEAVSFGKERPAVSGSDEAAWAKNRRAEINDR